MSLIGKQVEEFKADAFKKDRFVEVDQDTFKGTWSIVCFYPADFTFVCPTELEDLQEHYDEFKKLDAEVYAVSTDTHFSHMAWHNSSPAIGKVEYTMIGDPSHQLCKMFDVLIEGVGLADRGTFIIDPEGVIQSVEISAGGVGRQAITSLNKLKAAQFVRENGEVCPAKWIDTGETLTPGEELVGKI